MNLSAIRNRKNEIIKYVEKLDSIKEVRTRENLINTLALEFIRLEEEENKYNDG